ncbi:hypothetical protein DYB37_009218 [Aphanomyces astaci]|uniref:Uncharacterized protein n=1 Tax=Aphanomyces astaci TaxID=112090 RepID=A0A3R7EU10_APHAT|nr:hypothetical protein DYB37_009218 [Aphanomyces astaci]
MDPSIDACFAFVKTARHRTVTREERLDILRLHAWFRSQYTKAASKQVAHALGRNLNLVQDVWREYQASQTVTAATPSGNRTTHITKGPRTKLVTQMVQQFVRDRRATRTRTTAVEVMMYLKEICVLDIDVDDKKQFAASYRAVQRFLKAQGYKRGHRKGSSTYHLSTWLKALLAMARMLGKTLRRKRNRMLPSAMPRYKKLPTSTLEDVLLEDTLHHTRQLRSRSNAP